LYVVLRTRIMPRSGRDFDGRTSSTSLNTYSSSPGRTARGQLNSSKPTPRMPPAGLNSPSTISRMLIAAVCQPLAANPANGDCCAAASSRWNGCGSYALAKAKISSLSTRLRPLLKTCPTAKSSR